MATYDDILGGPAAQPRPPKKTTTEPESPTPGQTGTMETGGGEAEAPVRQQLPVSEGQDKLWRPAAPDTDARRLVGTPGYSARPMATGGSMAHEGAPRSKRQMSYVEMYEAMHPQKPETAEERAKREKRERGQAVLAAIGDGISALSNLYFTSQYSPHGFDLTRGQTATTKERWERLRREREANSRQYFEGYMRAMAMDDANDKEDRNWRHTIVREKIADARYEVKAAQDKALADLNEKLKNQQITAAEWKAEAERIKAKYAEDNEKLELGYKQAGIRQRNAAVAASRAKAESYSNGGSGGKGKKLTLTIGKDTFSYGSSEDYERAVERYAAEYGVKPYVAYEDGKDNLGRPKHTTKRKSTAQMAAEVERKAAERLGKQEDEFSQYEVRDDDEDDDFSEYEM